MFMEAGSAFIGAEPAVYFARCRAPDKVSFSRSASLAVFRLVPKLRLGTQITKLRFVVLDDEAELRTDVPKLELGNEGAWERGSLGTREPGTSDPRLPSQAYFFACTRLVS